MGIPITTRTDETSAASFKLNVIASEFIIGWRVSLSLDFALPVVRGALLQRESTVFQPQHGISNKANVTTHSSLLPILDCLFCEDFLLSLLMFDCFNRL